MKHELNIINSDGKPVVVEIREGQALPLKEPQKIAIVGNIDAVSRFLTKRAIDQKQSHVIVNREHQKIELVFDESNFYSGSVVGKLELSEAFNRFEINTGKEYTTYELADFFKMNRVFFEKPSVAANIVKELANFKAKVDKEIEQSDDRRGNKTAMIRQVVDSNIPEKFNLVLPLFKGLEKQTIEVEVNINPGNLNCTLISPMAAEIIDSITDQVVDQELKKFESLANEIVVIEQ